MCIHKQYKSVRNQIRFYLSTFRKLLMIIGLYLGLVPFIFSQSLECATSEPFCTSDIISFPAGGTTAEAEDGPCYDCVSPFLEDPAWFHMLISTSGDLEITIYNDNNVDIDYICWGPFDDPHAPCNNQLTCDKVLDCGVSVATTETCIINNAISGKYYILLITNYLSTPCNITFSKTGGSAETDCNIVPSAASNNSPICEGETLELYAEPINGASYFWTGPNGFSSNVQNPIISNAQLSNSGIYNLVVTLNGNSSSPYPTEVFINAIPQADFDFESVCEGSEVQFSDLSTCETPETPIISWNWDFGDGNTSTEPNPTHTYASGGPTSFEVSLIVETTGGCTNTTSQTIYIYPNPVALFDYTISGGSTCINSEVSFTDQSTSSDGAIIQWYWDFGDGQTSTEQNPVHSYSTSGNFTITLSIENENGCDSSYQNTILINPDPDIDFAFTEVCNGNETQFTDSEYINVEATDEWLYDFGDGTISTESNPNHLYGNPGSYEVVFSIVDTNGCSNSISHTVNVFLALTANFDFDNVCLFSTTHLNDISSPQYGIDYWEWDLGDGYSSNEQDVNYIYESAGDYDVQLIVRNDEGCNDTINQTVSVWEPPVSSFIYSDTSCTSGLLYFSDSSYSNENEINNLVWYFPDGHISYDPNTYFVFLNTELYYDVSLYVEDYRGCSDTLTEHIYIEPELTVSFNADTVCFGDKTTLKAYIVKPQSDSVVQYTWSFRDGSAQVSTPKDSILHIFTSPDNYEVMLQSESIDGCLHVVRKNVKVRENPTANFSFIESYCNDSSWFMDESEIAEADLQYWKWNFGDGDSLEIYHPDSPENYHFYPPQNATYNASLNVRDLFGCKDSIAYPVNHYPCILVNYYLGTSWICSNTPALFIDSSIVDPDYHIARKTWFFGDGAQLEVDPDADSIYYQYEAYGIYNSKLLVEYQLDQLWVKDSSEKVLEILVTPTADFSVEEVCLGNPSSFINNSSIVADQIEWIEWKYGDGQDSIIEFIPGQNEIHHQYRKDTSYLATLIVRAGNNCLDSVRKTTIIHPNPEIGFLADSTIFCGDAEVIFRDTSHINSGYIANRLWTFGDGDYLSSPLDTVAHHYEDGIYNVRLENTSDHFCTSTLEIDDYILINPLVEAMFDVDPREISISNKNKLEVINLVSEDVYLRWSLSDTIDWENISIPNIADSISDTGTYQLKQYTMNEYGCMDSVWVQFKVTPAYSFYVPTAFSPNGNGFNDTWGPAGRYFDLKSYDLKVFSRWGEMIFHSTDYFEHWDGKFPNGNPAPMGSYAYIIRLQDMDGNFKLVKGSVVLLL